jgi:hypothetical protein
MIANTCCKTRTRSIWDIDILKATLYSVVVELRIMLVSSMLYVSTEHVNKMGINSVLDYTEKGFYTYRTGQIESDKCVISRRDRIQILG